MAIHVAMTPPGGNAEKTVLVRDGFTFLAFVLPVLWFVWHRMWIEAALALALTLALGALDGFSGIGTPVATLLVSLLVGLEAPALRLWALRRRGWREAGMVEAENVAEAELRLFLGQEDGGDGGEKPIANAASFGRPPHSTVLATGLPDQQGIA